MAGDTPRDNGKKGGRPVGSTTRPQLRDQLTPRQIEALVEKAVEKAEAGDSILLKFLLEQIYGKAPQPLTGDKDNPLYLAGVEITVRKK
ncbi:MAG TPA: hypothetical protein VMT72_10435 [Pseudolabrys sp.]|nr:hypothetical protein [Pseudolabrys sp.]